jgi:prepilin-type N-terminal cleavage/methylation domain-containing protein
MQRVLSNQSGFTLIELLVTLAIFSTVMTAAVNIFVYTQKAQRRTEAKQATQTDARFALEVMQRQARAGRVDYSAYGGTISSNPQTVLALVNTAGVKVQFRRAEAAGRGEVQMSQDGGSSWSALTPPDLSVESLAFYLAPATDPFAANPATDRSPLTTIVMSTVNLREGGGDAPTFLQTSASSRQYLR